jgi:hypothetical protein
LVSPGTNFGLSPYCQIPLTRPKGNNSEVIRLATLYGHFRHYSMRHFTPAITG